MYQPYKYDPNNPLSDEELDELGKVDFEGFLEYLDSKTAHLKSKTRPMNSHELKQVAALSAAIDGRKISDKEWESIKEQGKINEEENNKRWQK